MAESETTEVLSARQYKALAALISASSIRQASEQAEIPEKTIYNWLKLPAFQAEYRVMRRVATQQAIGLLQKYSANAAATLCQLLSSGNPAAVRLAAASRILELAIKAGELEDVQQRLEALEQVYAAEHHSSVR